MLRTRKFTHQKRSTCLVALAALASLAASGDPTLPSYDCQPSYAFCREGDELLGYARGVSLIDIDGDGDDDLFAAFDTEVAPHISGSRVTTFFENQGGSFAVIDVGLDPADFVSSWGAAFGDYDRDGDPDMMASNGGYSEYSTVEFYENRMNVDGTFVDASAATGVAAASEAASFVALGGPVSPWWGTSAADYDNDGWVDFAVVPRIGRPLLFRNNRDKTFTEVGLTAGIDLTCSDCKNPVWTDYDGDGDLDLYVAGRGEHGFYENLGTGAFANVTAAVMDPHVPPVNPEVFSALATDFDHDGRDDLYLGRWEDQDYALMNQGGGVYTRHGLEAGLDSGQTPGCTENTMGLGTGDFDQDGYPDIYLGTGMPLTAGENVYFCNQRVGGMEVAFTRCTDLFEGGAASDHLSRSHGLASGDWDQDGDIDVVLNLGGSPAWDDFNPPTDSRQRLHFFRRQTPPGNTATLRLRGVISNTDAIGARVRVDGPETRYYTVRSAQGFQSQNSWALVLDLGAAAQAPATIFWPSGHISRVVVEAGQPMELVEAAAVPALPFAAWLVALLLGLPAAGLWLQRRARAG